MNNKLMEREMEVVKSTGLMVENKNAIEVDKTELPVEADDITQEIDDLKRQIIFLKELVEEATYDSFIKVINYYVELLRMDTNERSSSVYGLTSTYGLLLLNSTYDVSIKEIFRKRFSNALADKNIIQSYISGIIDNKILNRYMTNIKHKNVKDTFALAVDTNDAKLQRSIKVINDLIDTRNKIAHGLETSTKGHNDLISALESVIYYLNWYNEQLLNKFCES